MKVWLVILVALTGLTAVAPDVAQAQPYRRDWRRDDYDWRRNEAWRRQRDRRHEEWCYRHPWRCR